MFVCYKHFTIVSTYVDNMEMPFTKSIKNIAKCCIFVSAMFQYVVKAPYFKPCPCYYLNK